MTVQVVSTLLGIAGLILCFAGHRIFKTCKDLTIYFYIKKALVEFVLMLLFVTLCFIVFQPCSRLEVLHSVSYFSRFSSALPH